MTICTVSAGDAGLPRHAIFIDSRVPELERLRDAATSAAVHVLATNRDGLAQIAAILFDHGLRELDSISIVAYGRPGAIQLGAAGTMRSSRPIIPLTSCPRSGIRR